MLLNLESNPLLLHLRVKAFKIHLFKIKYTMQNLLNNSKMLPKRVIYALTLMYIVKCHTWAHIHSYTHTQACLFVCSLLESCSVKLCIGSIFLADWRRFETDQSSITLFFLFFLCLYPHKPLSASVG